MSWNCTFSKKTVEEAKRLVEVDVPPSMHPYVNHGIDYLVHKYGQSVLLNMSANGHLGADNNLEDTTASVKITRAIV